MSDLTAGARPTLARLLRLDPDQTRPTPVSGYRSADPRRLLQLGLAAIWLLDGVLQFQPFMFTKAFATQVILPTVPGNPAVVAHSITWAAGIIERHPASTNAAFALIQVLLGLAIAWRPTARAALAASVGWALAVWWFGEGLGGVLTGTASPLNGAPGGVILYALLAVLLWPTDRSGPFEAARAVGAGPARALWLLLWGSLAYFALSANTGPQDLNGMITGMEQGQPVWLISIMKHAAALVAHRGRPASIVLGVLLILVALAVLLPRGLSRAPIGLALALSVVIWVVGEALGGLFGGQGTDPDTGPLLVLLALAYWPAAGGPGRGPAEAARTARHADSENATATAIGPQAGSQADPQAERTTS